MLYEEEKFIRPHHERLINRIAKLEDMIADSQVVFQSEGIQHHTIAHWESQAQVIARVPCSYEMEYKIQPSAMFA